ncbi:c-type cytochrome biogenesis protein CcmI [Thalassotalea psychrophila]|uniref:C-type cytochrome biogenesis protein CcmI n=1 Tax=Thalassotalea psychrophila TaxID=3065647 RepID=A0ABY9TWF0_9GAMM|nr:c-type cytochrome biogenesis protein CcmI [Colwelliaceae bacterium SQ149]
MTTLWIITVLILIAAAAIIWQHFLKSSLYSANQSNMRGQTNKDLYHEHLAELEKDLAEGGIDQENFDYLKEELDHSLLLDMNATAKEEQAKDKATSFIWPAVITVFIVAFSAIYYQQHGAYAAVEIGASQPAAHSQDEESQAEAVIAQLKKLHKEVQDNPKNSDAWFQMGQILTQVGEFDSAFVAFGKVNEIEGEQADVLALQAQSMYYKNKQQRNEQIDELLERALMIDPFDATTLMLIGMDHYLNERFEQAAVSWQKIIDNGGAGANTQPLLDAINEANNKAGTNSHDGHDHPEIVQSTESPEQQTSTSVEGPSFRLNVSFSSNIFDEVSKGADKTVFIYATAANGSRMPLAAVKLKASDLPISVTLDNSKAMSPQANLSSTDVVNVYAVVSHSGTPGMKPGDFKGEISNVLLKSAVEMNIVIDTIVQ